MSLELFQLTNKVAIVTGAGKGIGSAIALGFAEAGADVVVAARTQADIDLVASQVRARGRKSLAVATDVRDKAAVDNLVSKTLQEFGRIDILINNAGTYIYQPVVQMSTEEWDSMFDANMRSVFFCCQAAARVMIGQKSGVMVNVSSMAGVVPDPGRSAYSASKAAVNNFTRNLSLELAPYNIRVNAIAPGLFITPGIAREVKQTRQRVPNFRTSVVDRVPLKRVGKPQELVGAAIFLASDASSYITGITLEVCGGLLALMD
ncbi:MAG: SDR family oxidoreductase [Chloroflexi bacterium]|nr:SDR family oxidoreductase [Chloroflexota bacterium]